MLPPGVLLQILQEIINVGLPIIKQFGDSANNQKRPWKITNITMFDVYLILPKLCTFWINWPSKAINLIIYDNTLLVKPPLLMVGPLMFISNRSLKMLVSVTQLLSNVTCWWMLSAMLTWESWSSLTLILWSSSHSQSNSRLQKTIGNMSYYWSTS